MSRGYFFGILAFSLFGFGTSCPRQMSEMEQAYSRLHSHTWQLSEINGLPALEPDYASGLPQLHFAPDSTYSGSSGCNRMGGRYNAGGGGTLQINPGFMSKMQCEGNGEATFLKALFAVKAYAVKDETLILLDANSKPVLRMVSAGKQ